MKPDKVVTKSRKYYLYITVAMLFWGTSWVSNKLLVSISTPAVIGFYRYFIACCLFIIFAPFLKESTLDALSRKNAVLSFAGGLTGIFGFVVLSLLGVNLTSAANASIIAGINPMTVSLFAHLFHGERLIKKWQYLGFVLALFGVFFVVGIQTLVVFSIEFLIGNVILIGAMLTWGLYSSIGKKAMKSVTAYSFTTASSIYGFILLGFFALAENNWTIPLVLDDFFWINIFFLSIFPTFIGFVLYFEVIKNLGATRTGVFISLVPLFGTAASVIILNEVLYWTFIIGLLLIVSGILFINSSVAERYDKSV